MTPGKTSFVSLDLARKQTYSARIELVRSGQSPDWRYVVTHAHRYTDRPPLWKILEELTTLPPEVIVCMDSSGLGDVVMQDAKRLGLRPQGVIITAGGNWHPSDKESGVWYAGEEALIQLVRQRLGSQLFFTGDPKRAVMLAHELDNYEYQMTDAGHLTYSARPGSYDDLLMALAIGVFVAERYVPAFGLSSSEVEALQRQARDAWRSGPDPGEFTLRRPWRRP